MTTKTDGGMKRRGRRAAWLMALGGTTCLMAMTDAFAAAPPQNVQTVRMFSIPPQPLEDGLARFGQQSGWQISVDGNLAKSVTTPGVRGTMTPVQALSALLSGTGLNYEMTGNRTAVLRRAPATITLGPVRVGGTVPADRPAGPADMLGPPVKGIVAQDGVSATKTDTPLIKIPQSISVVTNDQMRMLNVQSTAEALRYTSGMNSEMRGTNNNELEYLYARGFLIDEYWNGLHTPGPQGGYGYNVTTYDPYLLERVEFLHGPSSVMYGQGSPGGTVDLVSKMPTATPLHEMGIETGNWGRVQGFMDFSGPIDREGKLLYRLTFDAFHTGTTIDHVYNERFAVAPSLTWRPTIDTSLTLYAQYQADPEGGSYNAAPAVGTIIRGPVSIPRSLDLGDPSFDNMRKMQESIGYILTHQFSNMFSFKQQYRYLFNSQSIKYLQASGYADASDTSLARYAYLNEGTVNAHTLDNQFAFTLNRGIVHQKALIGVDYQHIDFSHDFYYGSAPSLNLLDPVYGMSIAQPSIKLATSGEYALQQAGLYAQDQIDIKHWSILLGLREDWAGLNFKSYTTNKTVYNQFSRAFTWRAGLVYHFDNGLAPYFSYSTSFMPQEGSDYNGKVFKPTTGKQYEAGIKYQPRGMNAFIRASAFHLVEDNVSTTDPVHTGFSVLTGQERSRGFEVEAHADLTRNLQLIGSYTYIDLLNTRSTTADRKIPVGIPRNTANLFLDYTVRSGILSGLQVGGGARYTGSSYGDTANSFKVPWVVVADLAMHYELGHAIPAARGTTLSFNITNLENHHYISSCYTATGCFWGAGRQVIAGARYNW